MLVRSLVLACDLSTYYELLSHYNKQKTSSIAESSDLIKKRKKKAGHLTS